MQKLADKVGRQEQFFGAHCHEWNTADRGKRHQQLLASHRQLDEALAKHGGRIEDYGWTTTRGAWHRVNEPAPTPVQPDAERIATATFQQVFEMLLDVPDARQATARRSELETALNDACAAGDLDATATAAATLLDWAMDLREAVDAGEPDMTQRQRVFAAGERLGFPDLLFRPAMSVCPGREGWLGFCNQDRDDLLNDLEEAIVRLRDGGLSRWEQDAMRARRGGAQ